jgi:hypothetical protein
MPRFYPKVPVFSVPRLVHLLKPRGFPYLCGNRRHFSASSDVTLFRVQPHTYERIAERVAKGVRPQKDLCEGEKQ